MPVSWVKRSKSALSRVVVAVAVHVHRGRSRIRRGGGPFVATAGAQQQGGREKRKKLFHALGMAAKLPGGRLSWNTAIGDALRNRQRPGAPPPAGAGPPAPVGITPQPGELPLGVVAGVLLDAGHGLVGCSGPRSARRARCSPPCAGCSVRGGEHGLASGFQTGGHHGVHAGVDAS